MIIQIEAIVNAFIFCFILLLFFMGQLLFYFIFIV